MTTEVNKKTKEPMIKLSRVVYYRWSETDGKLLKALRGKVTQQELSNRISDLGGNCHERYVRKLEAGQADSISIELALQICQALKIKPESLLDIEV